MERERNEVRVQIYMPERMYLAVQEQAVAKSASFSGFVKTLIADNVPGAVPHVNGNAERAA